MKLKDILKSISITFLAIILILIIMLVAISLYYRFTHWKDIDNKSHLMYVEATDTYNGTAYKFCIRNNLNFPILPRIDISDECHNKTVIYLDYIDANSLDCGSVIVSIEKEVYNICGTYNYEDVVTTFRYYDAPSGNLLETEKTKYKPLGDISPARIINITVLGMECANWQIEYGYCNKTKEEGDSSQD